MLMLVPLSGWTSGGSDRSIRLSKVRRKGGATTTKSSHHKYRVGNQRKGGIWNEGAPAPDLPHASSLRFLRLSRLMPSS
jgi:hypothetical protein